MSLIAIFEFLVFLSKSFAGGIKLMTDLDRLQQSELGGLIKNSKVRVPVLIAGLVSGAAALLFIYVSSRSAPDGLVPKVPQSTSVAVLPSTPTAPPRPAAMEPCPVGVRLATMASDLEACLNRSGCLGSTRICLGLSNTLQSSPSIGEPCEVAVGRRLPIEEARSIADRLRAGSCWRESYSWLAGFPGMDGEHARLVWLKLACERNPGVVTDGTLGGFNLPLSDCG